MHAPYWILTHHAVSIATSVLVFLLARSLLRQRRPASNLIAWLLAIVLIPYLGIPLYLIFGGRKLSERIRSKRRLDADPDQRNTDHGQTSLQTVRWLDEGVLAFECFLAEIQHAQRSIRIVTFVLADDDAGRPLVRALIERARQGLEVRLLIRRSLALSRAARIAARAGVGRRTGRALHAAFASAVSRAQ